MREYVMTVTFCFDDDTDEEARDTVKSRLAALGYALSTVKPGENPVPAVSSVNMMLHLEAQDEKGRHMIKL